jgi:uncharacterized protein with PQ loop repeat
VNLEVISGTIATMCGMAFIWPQVFRIYRHRTVEGLSAPTVLVGFVATVVYCLVMNEISPYVVGVTGLVVSTPMFLPQLWKAVRTSELHGVSAWANLIFSVQCAFWVVYGIEVEEWLYIYPNAILLPCGLIIAWRVIRSRRTLPVDVAGRRS